MVPEWAKSALLIGLGGQDVREQELIGFGVLESTVRLVWVRRVVLRVCRRLPVYPTERTSPATVGGLQECQNPNILRSADE